MEGGGGGGGGVRDCCIETINLEHDRINSGCKTESEMKARRRKMRTRKDNS